MAAITDNVNATFIRNTTLATGWGGALAAGNYKINQTVSMTPADAALLMRKQYISVSNNPANTAIGNDPDAPRRVERLVAPETTNQLAVEN